MTEVLTYEALKAERDALAVENAALKQSEVPLGAIENGRAFADRLEAYPFECQGGNLSMCSDWQELIRCFEHLSEWAMRSKSETPATDAALAAIQAQGVEKSAAALDALSAQSASATTQGNFRAAAVYLRTTVLPEIGEAK
ncbi:hypothetical protein [Serratia marcescens]|uniref:hypothetical protein n=1 Tax=Serratia marcescens TaxID=615 RepID=UPI0018D70181|nr:hypothetical protein [Serratia marcescens]MBH3213194.1 hypothetical protein [Serratia marcescens]